MTYAEKGKKPLELLGRYRAALMGFAALYILLYHCWIPIVPERPILGSIEKEILYLGYIGVEIFFFLSGMGLTYAARKKEKLSVFYLKRLKRLVFPFVLMGALEALFSGRTFAEFFCRVTGISFVTESIFVFLWYVPASMVLYLLFPLYHRWISRSGSDTAFTANAIGVWFLLTLALRDIPRQDVFVFTNRIPVFLLGILAGRLAQKKEIVFRPVHWVGCGVFFLLSHHLTRMGNKGQIVLHPEMNYSLYTAALAVTACIALVMLFDFLDHRKGPVGASGRKLIAFLSFSGGFTLELYCVHQWLYGWISPFLEGKVTYLAINLISLPVLFAAGWLLGCLHRGFWKAAAGLKPALQQKK